MTFSMLEWLYARLPDIGVPWVPEWPQDFVALPRASFRLADDSVGVVTTEGEGSAEVSAYTDTWHLTPEDREIKFKQLKTALIPTGLNRGMTRQTVEQFADGRIAYRLTVLWRGEYDHGTGRMCRP